MYVCMYAYTKYIKIWRSGISFYISLQGISNDLHQCVGYGVTDDQFVFSVSLFVMASITLVSICVYPTCISTFYFDSKELVLFANQKWLHSWVALTLTCSGILLVVGMSWGQKTTLYCYANLNYGFKVMDLLGRNYSFLDFELKINFISTTSYELPEVSNSSSLPSTKELL